MGGTSVSVTVGSTTVSAPMYYTSATQVAALLPSNTPTGSGTLTVTYSGTASAAVAVFDRPEQSWNLHAVIEWQRRRHRDLSELQSGLGDSGDLARWAARGATVRTRMEEPPTRATR